MDAFGVPAEESSHRCYSRDRLYESSRVGNHQRSACSRYADPVSVRIVCPNQEIDIFSCHDTERTQWIQDRRIVVALVDVDLQISGDRTHEFPTAQRPDTVFAHQQSKIVLTHIPRDFPADFSCGGVDPYRIGYDRWVVGVEDLDAGRTSAIDELVAQAVAIGVECTGIVVKRLVRASVVYGWIQQLCGVVRTELSIDPQRGLDVKGHIHRIGNIAHP